MNLPAHLGGHANETHLDEGVLNYMISKYKIESFLDVGCGPGGMLDLASSKGLRVLGVDGDFTLTHNNPVIIHDYTTGPAPIEGEFDLCWSCEFLEHVSAEYIPNFMNSFQKAKHVIVTHAFPGQGGHHHVNEQEYRYWVESFANYGFKFSASESIHLRDISTMKSGHLNRSGLFFNKVVN
jgi:SAM-dependent methyltransferase